MARDGNSGAQDRLRRRWPTGLLVALLAALATTGCVVLPPANNPPADGVLPGGGAGAAGACTEPAEADTWQAAALLLINQERVARGLPPLTPNPTLEAVAARYACDMIAGDFFAHVDPATGGTLGDRIAASGYDYQVVGENLAAGQRTPREVVQDWMASDSHRENLLDQRFIEAGLSVRAGGRYGYYWVLELGRPR